MWQWQYAAATDSRNGEAVAPEGRPRSNSNPDSGMSLTPSQLLALKRASNCMDSPLCRRDGDESDSCSPVPMRGSTPQLSSE